ncbi:adenine phosphoribosyltransferase [Reyranella sp.]|jgi:adenine phosphoribosyltransferase|uniref:adenine phosphoribosyltransferase n=1 Tax=Reyranella sp. TaxID=1929291 RepID=UPI000BC3C6B5|nr:adenine phosphoribosyltransferase [Reyranella sp.]OYY33573.1 MAG: adenine phosphoribosyltransferase [Rhodospirillales bacterium 35-66-84]OYZ90660.1 MAG: adenine phosphoribosyltransferase [Rhodospirillales bacterium 24-66-33]OZB20979.1 MAG: adenine phosphoribosyltransferase [Rhodospirillales bacterium 39-66-50]HQS19383.1 adenine phosphoribosyltransferase [Reyranella sp.]HQT15646.1 adenine phosphoribosyltransferase [Reyranella sp.]
MSKDLDLKKHIRSIPDFPKPGILFYDISTLLAHAKAWHTAIERLADLIRPHKPDMLAGIESRGFLLAAPLALALGTGFVMMRKQGKLPGTTVRHTYALEYGTDTIEIQQDAVHKGARVVLVDDLLATGGTMSAAVNLLETVGAVVPATAVIIELTFLEGRKRLTPPVETLLQYDS